MNIDGITPLDPHVAATAAAPSAQEDVCNQSSKKLECFQTNVQDAALDIEQTNVPTLQAGDEQKGDFENPKLIHHHGSQPTSANNKM